ncbi:Spo0B domain-containing protein [Bacillaceae bacterium Marseille-Q3522]|nr:Spo0B domain-containing protein [Bacillaceae bacterium Marseille-Q3522]
MEKEWNLVEVLRHSRHDWLNKIQLIKGNIAMNRIERAMEIIDEIVYESREEAKLSNMNIPQFAAFILCSNWADYYFQTEYEVLNDSKVNHLDDSLLTEWTKVFFTCLHTSVKAFYHNHLFLSLEPLPEGVRFFFDFRGIIEDKEKISQFLQSKQTKKLQVEVQEMSNEELVLKFFVPYRSCE